MDTRQRIINENEQLLDLWQKAKTGDKLAYCRLAESQYRALFTYGLNFTDDRDFVKDCLQEIFIHIWEKRHTLQLQYVSIYFFKSLRNQILQEFRRASRPLSPLYSPEAANISDWQTVETDIERGETDRESRRRVRRAIDSLPKRQQEAVFLKFYEGLENDQIAEVMEINRQSVANLLYKALGALKDQMSVQNYWLIALCLLADVAV